MLTVNATYLECYPTEEHMLIVPDLNRNEEEPILFKHKEFCVFYLPELKNLHIAGNELGEHREPTQLEHSITTRANDKRTLEIQFSNTLNISISILFNSKSVRVTGKLLSFLISVFLPEKWRLTKK